VEKCIVTPLGRSNQPQIKSCSIRSDNITYLLYCASRYIVSDQMLFGLLNSICKYIMYFLSVMLNVKVHANCNALKLYRCKKYLKNKLLNLHYDRFIYNLLYLHLLGGIMWPNVKPNCLYIRSHDNNKVQIFINFDSKFPCPCISNTVHLYYFHLLHNAEKSSVISIIKKCGVRITFFLFISFNAVQGT
jgi:hypothetical protein